MTYECINIINAYFDFGASQSAVNTNARMV